MRPLVSVLLPVYNCAHYVHEAISSILRQTFVDFELLVLDDGSTDDTPRVLAGISDPRMLVLQHANKGLPATLNRGISLAKGKYIARQDADDVSLPERLARQVQYMEAHPECGLLGTWSSILRDRAETGRMHKHPADHATLAFEILFDSQFVHPSVMFRRSVVETVGGYSTDISKRGPEDYDLWVRIARQFRMANIPEPLIQYREIEGSMSRSGGEVWRQKVMRISGEAIAWAADVELPDRTVEDLVALWHYGFSYVSPSPDFGRMREIVSRAAVRVAEPRGEEAALRRAEVRVLELNRRYREHSSLGRTQAPSRAARWYARLRAMARLDGSK